MAHLRWGVAATACVVFVILCIPAHFDHAPGLHRMLVCPSIAIHKAALTSVWHACARGAWRTCAICSSQRPAATRAGLLIAVLAWICRTCRHFAMKALQRTQFSYVPCYAVVCHAWSMPALITRLPVLRLQRALAVWPAPRACGQRWLALWPLGHTWSTEKEAHAPGRVAKTLRV